LPAFSQVLRYGDLTAKGIAGGLAGEKVDAASPTEAARAAIAAATQESLIFYVSKNEEKWERSRNYLQKGMDAIQLGDLVQRREEGDGTWHKAACGGGKP
jgi:hypothetical protein